MKRIASHFLFSSPHTVLRTHAIHLDDNQCIQSIYDIHSGTTEAHQTQFLDGILSLSHYSIKLHHSDVEWTVMNYQYVDLSGANPILEFPHAKELILDFGTEDPTQICAMVELHFEKLLRISIFDLIAASVYHPRMALNISAVPSIGMCDPIYYWSAADLVNKRITPQLKIFTFSDL